MSTVSDACAPPTIEESATSAWQRAGEYAGRDLRLYWECETRGRRRAAAVLACVLVRFLTPALVMPFQSVTWCVRWRHLTDTLASPLPQIAALVWTGGLLSLFGLNPATAVFVAPAIVVTAFGVGRLVYPLTPRGRARGLFPPDGWATWPELRQGVSAHAARQNALYARPTIKQAATPPGATRPSDWALARMPVSEFGTWVGNTAIGTPWRVRTCIPHENAKLIVAPPRSLKTALQTSQLIDHPGPALSTQTKVSTFKDSRWLREAVAHSGRVDLLDPEHLTGEKSTFRWPCERGCSDYRRAEEIAAALVGGAVKLGNDDGPWLSAQATAILRCLLLIADVTGRDMADVFVWATSVAQCEKALALMDRHSSRIPHGWREAMAGVLGSGATRTIGAVFLALGDAVGFMSDPDIADLCLPQPDDTPFDVRQFLADRGTVYLIASERPNQKAGPLLAAFTVHLVEEAKRIAMDRDGERLDPPLQLNLDEVANTIVMPLPKWAADTGGRGIECIASVQSKSQMVERWGDAGATTVWNAMTTKVIAGGLTDSDDLLELSALSGSRREWRGEQLEVVPVLTVDQARRIPRWHAVVVSGVMRMTLVRVKPAFLRIDVIRSKLRVRPDSLTALPAVIEEAPS